MEDTPNTTMSTVQMDMFAEIEKEEKREIVALSKKLIDYGGVIYDLCNERIEPPREYFQSIPFHRDATGGVFIEGEWRPLHAREGGDDRY